MDYVKLEQQLKELLSTKEEFIDSPLTFIANFSQDIDEQEIVELLRFIHVHNYEIVEQRQKHIIDMKQKISSAKPLHQVEETKLVQEQPEEQPFASKIDPTYINSILTSSDLLTELENRVSSLSKEELTFLKMQLHLKQNKLKRIIREKIMLNPSLNIKEYQEELELLELAEVLISEQQSKEEVVEEQRTSSRIIFVPNASSSYLYNDISEYENKKEIKITFDKLVDGYFLMTKDIKSLEGYKNAKLCEYTHPNGIRILYVISDDIICVCSLFYKDKQKSKKIANYYEEAIRRFLSQIDYIKENYQTPDFIIEQDEIIGDIYSLLETGKKLKKGGDSNE